MLRQWMRKRWITAVLLISLCLLVIREIDMAAGVGPQAPKYYRIVVLADPHYPFKPVAGDSEERQHKIMSAQEKAIEDLNAWTDVDLVVIVGDVVASTGSEEEYAQAKAFVGRIKKPVVVTVGNHEYMYADEKNAAGKHARGSAHLRAIKLNRFQQTFGQKLYHNQTLGQYHLLFLSPDVIDGRFLTEVSDSQLRWLATALKEKAESPALIFFHAPLAGTLLPYSANANKPNFIAQPEARLREILRQNQQIKAWVSGHTHTPPTTPSFNHSVNYYDGRVLNIHNSDMDRQTICTNSLYLYPDRIEVKTFNHRTGQWVKDMDRTL